MKTMKKSVSIVLALLMALSVFVVAPTVANAGGTPTAGYIEMFNIWGSIDDYNDYETGSFELSATTKVKFRLAGSYSEGYYRILVENDYGKPVLEKSGYVDTEDINYIVSLPKGDYTAYIYNNSEPDEEDYNEELKYDFYAYRYYNPPKNPTKLKLNRTKLTLNKNGTYQLNATYKPDDVTSKLKFTSSNKSVAKVDSSGYVTAKNLGTAVIKATMGNKKATCKVTVNYTYFQMAAGKSKSLVSYVKKAAGYKKAKWSSSKKSIVSVDKKGKIKTLKHGVAKIKAKIKGKTYTIKVYAVSKSGVKKRTLTFLKDRLYVPQSLKVEKVKFLSYNGVKIYYKAKNIYGDYIYNAITGYLWYDILYYHYDH